MSEDSSLINNASSGGSERSATFCDGTPLFEKEEPLKNSRSFKGTTLENMAPSDSSFLRLAGMRSKEQGSISSPQNRPEGFIEQVVKVFFKGLKKTTTFETVCEAFGQLNRIKYMRFPFSVLRKKNMGYGFVIFEDQEFAASLIHEIGFVEIEGARVCLSEFRKESRAEMRTLGRKENKKPVPAALEGKLESSPSASDEAVVRLMDLSSQQPSEQQREQVSATWHRIKPTSAHYHKSKHIPRGWHNSSNVILNIRKTPQYSKSI